MNADKVNKWLTTLTNIGVLVGILLLVYELNQNAALMRAEIHAMRAEAKAERQMSMANSGEIIGIFQKAMTAGFPKNPEFVEALTAEERMRISIFLSGMKETVSNWHFQCQKGMLDEELCRASYKAQVRNLLPWLKAMKIGLSDTRESFLADVRRIALDEGLPVPNEDGSW